jgi:hypothetical protein
MALSMFQASVPVLIRQLSNLSHILAVGAAHAEAKKIDPSVFINARLAPDMFPLVRQVQIAADAAKGCAARLAGAEVPSHEDFETTFPELQARIEKTIGFLKGFTADQINGSENKEIELKAGSRILSFKGQSYLLVFVLPNMFFHMTTAYNILRHNGVELGKMDYLGGLD